MKVNEKFAKKLLVEGNDDQHVLFALCEKHQIDHCFDIVDCEGIDKLFDQIPIRLKQSNIEVIGIILDADSDLRLRWDRLINIISPLGFNFPPDMPEEGLILINDQQIKIGIWIMPNNDLSGMLEDFIAFMVPADDLILPIVNKTMQEIEDAGINKYALIHKSKAKIHSWLALQQSPGSPMGLSITKQYLNAENETCDSLSHNWLKQLYH
ncbi:DUF3226 domain-containing protein [Pedobacter sp. NJ-S-72]